MFCELSKEYDPFVVGDFISSRYNCTCIDLSAVYTQCSNSFVFNFWCAAFVCGVEIRFRRDSGNFESSTCNA